MSSAGPRVAAWAPRFWWACAIGGPFVAFGIAAAGYPMAKGRDPVGDLVSITLWSIAEEIVFRGALQPAVARGLARFGRAGSEGWPVTPSNLVTSLLFAALHAWRHPLAVALGVFPVSLVYGMARDLSGRWWPAAALHLYFNLLLYAAS